MKEQSKYRKRHRFFRTTQPNRKKSLYLIEHKSYITCYPKFQFWYLNVSLLICPNYKNSVGYTGAQSFKLKSGLEPAAVHYVLYRCNVLMARQA
jgi:hypothetical protein